MSGGPPHHPHGRQVPAAANTAWNHLQVPNYFPRQPQHAHMSNEHSLLHPHQTSTWHTPTATEPPLKPLPPHTNMYPVCFPRTTAPGVDLSVTRNGQQLQQNGEPPAAPISLSVRDANKINSLPASALEVVQLTKCTSPSLKSASPGLQAESSPKTAPTPKRSNKRVDSILERLNPNVDKNTVILDKNAEGHVERISTIDRIASFIEKTQPNQPSTAGSSHDENSNSSSILNVPTPTNIKEEDAISTYSNDDSLDSNKSRRKRKPSKTVRVSKDDDLQQDNGRTKDDHLSFVSKMLEHNKIVERRRSSDDVETIVPAKTRRKTSSESETIDNIAAMVQECVKDKPKPIPEQTVDVQNVPSADKEDKPALVKVVNDSPSPKTSTPLVTPAQKKAIPTQFVEVENKLEEMFAGIEDDDKLEDKTIEQDKPNKKAKRPYKLKNKSLDTSLEGTPKKKKVGRKSKDVKQNKSGTPTNKKAKGKSGKLNNTKIESMKEIYAYDSGSNASSSKSRGPFIQIKGPRDSPISVNVVNAPQHEDDTDKKSGKNKKYHDDSEYRHKVRSRGLHCSTLSNKYDAQTKDTTWICAFCKRGPHATDLSGPSSNGDNIPAGDLFGPYIITSESPAFDARLDDPYDRQFKSKKIGKVLDDSALSTKVKKSKKRHSDLIEDGDPFLGITDTGAHKSFEVWAHEDCIVWSPGTYLVGAKIVGLEESVWTCCNISCKLCGLKGANICCLKRGCLNSAHVCCSRAAGWHFDADSYRTFCPQHVQ